MIFSLKYTIKRKVKKKQTWRKHLQILFLDRGMHELSNFKGKILKMSKLFEETVPQIYGKQAREKTSIIHVAYG